MPDMPAWKQSLLASNAPLQYEASEILAAQGFVVDADYKYAPAAGGAEAAADIRAVAFSPFSDADQAHGRCDVLAQCRHRPAEAVWLFTPDPNAAGGFSGAGGGALRAVDHFSTYALEPGAAAAFEKDMPVCRKGLELNLTAGEVDAAAFAQDLLTLQYALPRLFTDNALAFMTERPEMNLPFFFLPVLVTNVRLMAADKGLSVQAVEAAEDIGDIARQVPCLVLHLDYGPDFAACCARECRRLKALQKSDKAMMAEQKRARHFNSREDLPFTVIESLLAADRRRLNAFFTRFVICDAACFGTLLARLKETVSGVLKTRKPLS